MLCVPFQRKEVPVVHGIPTLTTEEELRQQILKVQRQVELCRKQLEVAEMEVVLLTDHLAALAAPNLDRPPLCAGRFAGM
jgi:hypothetical protein